MKVDYEPQRLTQSQNVWPNAKILEERYAKIRSFLDANELGALIAYSPPAANMWGQTGHVAYLSGWGDLGRTVDSAVVVPLEGPPTLLYAGMPFMEEAIADVSPIKDVRLVQAVDPNAVAVARPIGNAVTQGPRSFAANTREILQERKIFFKGIGVVGINNMSLPFFEALSQELGENLYRVDDIIAELRSVKTSDELELMRHAAHLGDLGFKAMMEISRPGMRGIEIIAEMERAARKEGADHVKFWMASGPPTTWEDSKMDMKPHERVLEDGDFMQVCSYIVYRGYWSHGQRTGTLRRPSEYLEEISTIARNGQDAGIAVMKPNISAGSIATAVREKVAESGWNLQGGRVGHGCGLDYSEIPIPSEGSNHLLQIGNTIILHSAFSLPDSGKLFVPLGDQLHLTLDGPEFLMKFPRTLFLAGN
jgi:Xaa-Pro aminopeptidase